MKTKPKFKKKEFNIAALQSSMRKYRGTCHYSDIIDNPRAYRKKRLFRREAGYISR